MCKKKGVPRIVGRDHFFGVRPPPMSALHLRTLAIACCAAEKQLYVELIRNFMCLGQQQRWRTCETYGISTVSEVTLATRKAGCFILLCFGLVVRVRAWLRFSCRRGHWKRSMDRTTCGKRLPRNRSSCFSTPTISRCCSWTGTWHG